MKTEEYSMEENPLVCEAWRTFLLLTFVGGFFGAFTYAIRGGVFCNAQTANVVLCAMSLGRGEWSRAAYYLIPISAYILGAFISESVPNQIKTRLHIRWDTAFLALEMAVVVFLGLLPENAPYQITQVVVNLIMSMQYNTFRQTRHIPMATTFCTNHIRQIGIAASRALRHRDGNAGRRILAHGKMLVSFAVGAAISTVLCKYLFGRAILLTLLPLGFLFIDFLREDLRSGAGGLSRKPEGH